MYLRPIHAESHIPTLRQFIKDNPLGTFTTAITSPEYPFLQASHIPWILDVKDDTSESDLSVLRGHMAPLNPQAKAIIESATSTAISDGTSAPPPTGGVQLDNEVLVLFTAPVHHYVTPKFYTDTKPVTGKVVPRRGIMRPCKRTEKQRSTSTIAPSQRRTCPDRLRISLNMPRPM